MIILSPEVQAVIRHRAKREGLKLHLASYGGSGTVFTVEWLDRFRRIRCMPKIWHSILNHYAYPIDLGIPRVCLMADPPTAYYSVIHRGLSEGVTRAMHGGQHGQDQVAGMVAFFDNWTTASPLIFCKYEHLHENLRGLSDALGISFRNFPPRRDRKTKIDGEEVDYRLLALRERFNQLPDFFTK
jgi:hypothetical protein